MTEFSPFFFIRFRCLKYPGKIYKIIYNNIFRCLLKALKQAETDTEVNGETVKENQATRRLKIYFNCMQDTLSK